VALAHIKNGKSASETALALRGTPHAVTQWLKWFVIEGLDRVLGMPIIAMQRVNATLILL
jgi:hypothetical protein